MLAEKKLEDDDKLKDKTSNMEIEEKQEDKIPGLDSVVQEKVLGWINSCMNKETPFEDVLQLLLLEEKAQRKKDEEGNTTFTILETVKICYEFREWTHLKEQIISISKRHGQFKKAIQKMVQIAMPFIEKTPDLDSRISFIDCLLEVAEGKIYLELERARMTMQKCKIYETEKNDPKKAAEVVQDLQVETYGSIQRREKTEYILEQMRIFLKTRDPGFFLRAKIRSKHIGEKTLKLFPDLAIKFHRLLLEIYHTEEDYLALTESLITIKELQKNQKELDKTITEAVVSVILAKFSEKQVSLMEKLNKDSKLEENLECKKLLEMFTTHEIIQWPFPSTSTQNFVENFTFSTKYGDSTKITETFRLRTIQHNIRVIGRYYTDIRMKRLADFLGVDMELMEKHLGEMVVSKEIHAKIDRLGGTVSFTKSPVACEEVNKWNKDLDNLVHLLESTCHEIHRETMVQKSKTKKKI